MRCCAHAGMFDGNRAIHEQRCAPPGSGLGVELEMRPDGSLGMAPDSGTPLDDWQLHILLAGGHRNRITQPVSHQAALNEKCSFFPGCKG